MVRRRPYTLGFIALAGGIVWAELAACRLSPERQHELLTFFFDGVPPLGSVPVSEGGSGRTVPRRGRAAVRRGPPPGERRYPLIAHRKFKCSTCHLVDQGMAPRESVNNLCITCHDKAFHDRAYVHGPVVLSLCHACHAVHSSKFPGVLVQEQRELCASCHSEPDLMQPAYHQPAGQALCTTCHDPHGADNRFFLRPRPPAETPPAAPSTAPARTTDGE